MNNLCCTPFQSNCNNAQTAYMQEHAEHAALAAGRSTEERFAHLSLVFRQGNKQVEGYTATAVHELAAPAWLTHGLVLTSTPTHFGACSPQSSALRTKKTTSLAEGLVPTLRSSAVQWIPRLQWITGVTLGLTVQSGTLDPKRNRPASP